MKKKLIQSVLVKGEGYAPILVACALARFVIPDPRKIEILSTALTPDSQSLWLRSDMDQLHRSLGIERSHMVAISETKSPEGFLKLNGDLQIPYFDYGSPLKGVPFYQIWLKEYLNDRGEDLGNFNPSLSSCHFEEGYWQIDLKRYEKLLRSILRHAGIEQIYSNSEELAEEEYDIVIDTKGYTQKHQLKDADLYLGDGRFPAVGTTVFSLMVLQRNLLALVQNFPRIGSMPIEQGELNRKLDSILPSLEDMQSMFVHDFDVRDLSERIKYRAELWLDMGRVVPYEDDLFSSHQWLGIMHQRFGPPKNYSRLADSISPKEAAMHLQQCRIEGGV